MALIFDRGGSIVSGVFVQFLFADHTFDTDTRDYLLQNHDRVVSKHRQVEALGEGEEPQASGDEPGDGGVQLTFSHSHPSSAGATTPTFPYPVN